MLKRALISKFRRVGRLKESRFGGEWYAFPFCKINGSIKQDIEEMLELFLSPI